MWVEGMRESEWGLCCGVYAWMCCRHDGACKHVDRAHHTTGTHGKGTHIHTDIEGGGDRA